MVAQAMLFVITQNLLTTIETTQLTEIMKIKFLQMKTIDEVVRQLIF